MRPYCVTNPNNPKLSLRVSLPSLARRVTKTLLDEGELRLKSGVCRIRAELRLKSGKLASGKVWGEESGKSEVLRANPGHTGFISSRQGEGS